MNNVDAEGNAVEQPPRHRQDDDDDEDIDSLTGTSYAAIICSSSMHHLKKHILVHIYLCQILTYLQITRQQNVIVIVKDSITTF